MNKDRRKRLSDLAEKLRQLCEEVEEIKDEEESYIESIPENLCGSEKYEKAECAIDELDASIDSITDAVNGLETAQE